MTKSKIIMNPELCDFCGTCVAVCPADAILLKESVIEVDGKLCTLCKSCVVICPMGAPEVRS